MKVLILSVRVGSGHTAIANNIANCFQSHGDTTLVKEIFESSKYHDWLISDLGFKAMFKFPHVGNYFYDKALESDKHVYHKFVKAVKDDLIALVNEFSPDIIISTHIAGRIFVKSYGQFFDKPVTSYLISTDYELPPGIVDYSQNEYIIVPNEDFIPILVAKGFKQEAILPYGVPIKTQYYNENDKNIAQQKLGIALDKNKRAVLLMGKKNGLGQVYKSIKKLAKHDDLEIICLYGSNQKLKKHVQKIAQKSPAKIHIFDFNSEDIMSIPDVIVGKMGGLSSTEAITKRVPVVSCGYSPKPEYSNLQYFKSKHTAIEVSKPKQLYNAVISMDVNEYKSNCESLRKPDTAQKIYIHAHKTTGTPN